MNSELLFVIDNLNTGGAQRQIVNLALGMSYLGYQVELFCYAPGDSSRNNCQVQVQQARLNKNVADILQM